MFNMAERVASSILCEKCNITFTLKKNLNAHVRQFHPEQGIEIKAGQLCGMCNCAFRTVALLHEHLQNQHSVNLQFIEKTFYSEEEFMDWKTKIEGESQSSFIIRNSSVKKGAGKKLSYYVCHRSGCFKPKDDRIRQIKSSGSIKSGVTCPAMINVSTTTVDGISEIQVKYQSVHIGHDIEVGKLRLAKNERLDLAVSLQHGIPMSKILDKTREKFSSTSRLGLTTRKDLHNISRDFQINTEIVAHQDDATSVAILVEKLKSESSNPVLIYKPVGKNLPDYPKVNEEDFMIGLMNDAQEKLFELYGSSCVMIDSTHGTNQYGFELTTLMVHDENHEGLPVATLFSSRTGIDILLPFFESIKKRIPALKTAILMTDDTNSFVNAWEIAFSDKPVHLLCVWHINKNINKNINTKVKNSENKSIIKSKFKDILTEIDETTFESLVKEFVEEFKEGESSFIQYLENTYLTRAKKWAYCYRIGFGINTNMKLERWHRQIKYEESGGIVMKRLDKSISIIMNAISKKLLSRVISTERGKLTHRMAQIRKRHKLSIEMTEGEGYSFVKLNDSTYVITKEVGHSIFTYNVEKNNSTCCCNVKCDQCSVCIHSMSCTCIDYCIKFVICKHIHFICLNAEKCEEEAANHIEEADSSEEDNLSIHIDSQKEKQVYEKNAILPALEKQEENLNLKKSIILQELKELELTVRGWDTLHPLPAVHDKIKSIKAMFQIASASAVSCESKELKEISKAPPNKLIAKQRKFKTKKASKKSQQQT